MEPSNSMAGSKERRKHGNGNASRPDEAMQTPKKASSQNNDWMYGRQQSYTFDDVVDSPVISNILSF
jgi:hypothetical protein